MEVYWVETLLDLIDFMTDTPRKRHIVGGVLMSFALLFTGLAITVLTLNKKEQTNECS